MQRFKSPRHAQCLLSTHSWIHNHFQLRRHHLTASEHRAARDVAFKIWRDAAGIADVRYGLPTSRRYRPSFSNLTIPLAAIEFVADPATKRRFDPPLKVGPRVSATASDRKLIARAMPHGDILGFASRLTPTRAEVDEMAGITVNAVREVTKTLRSEMPLACPGRDSSTLPPR